MISYSQLVRYVSEELWAYKVHTVNWSVIGVQVGNLSSLLLSFLHLSWCLPRLSTYVSLIKVSQFIHHTEWDLHWPVQFRDSYPLPLPLLLLLEFILSVGITKEVMCSFEIRRVDCVDWVDLHWTSASFQMNLIVCGWWRRDILIHAIRIMANGAGQQAE